MRLNHDLKRSADAEFDGDNEPQPTAKKPRGEYESATAWPSGHPVGFSDVEQDSRLKRSDKGSASADLRLDQVFSSRRGRGGLSAC